MVRSAKTQKMDNVNARIPVILFEEGAKFVAYSPAIDLSTCGDSEEQARKRFVEAATIFFDEITHMGTIDDVLIECGWQKVPGKQTWLPPQLQALHKRAGPDFTREELNLASYHAYKLERFLPCGRALLPFVKGD
jgi:hypothetical protein